MRTSRNSRVVLVAGVLFFTLGFVAAVGSWVAYRLDTGIERNGQRVEGHITRKSLLFVADGDSDYNVEYWFQLPSGERVESARGVHKGLWSTLKEGESLVVLYSTENPKRNFPLGGGVTSIGTTAFVSFVSTIVAVFGALLIVSFMRSRKTDT